jgi:hypothetical protein
LFNLRQLLGLRALSLAERTKEFTSVQPSHYSCTQQDNHLGRAKRRSFWFGALKNGGNRKVAEKLVNDMQSDLFKRGF